LKYKKEIEHVAVVKGGMQKIRFIASGNDLTVEGTDGTKTALYKLPLDVAVGYATSYGMWTFFCDGGGITFRANNSDTEERAVVFEVDPGPGRHYNRLIEDDIASCETKKDDVEAEVKAAAEWYERTQGIDFANPLQPKLNWPSKIKWDGITVEGGDKMKALYHVILFNRKTEEIDFKEYVSAKSEMDATMLAAQAYSSYDSDVHKVIVKLIECSEYKPIG
jgi:hypothetical protein